MTEHYYSKKQTSALNPKSIDVEMRDRTFKLVTGAGGSIGTELCRQIARFHPSSLIMLEMGETELFNIDMEIREGYPDLYLLSIVGEDRTGEPSELVHKADPLFERTQYTFPSVEPTTTLLSTTAGDD